MSSPKPDYFIASNGLPNILNKNNNTRHMMIRQIPTATIHTRNRMHNQQRNLYGLHKDDCGNNNNNNNKSLKNKQNFMEMLEAPTSTVVDKNKRNNHLNLKKSSKDLINSEIKASNSNENSTYTFLSTSPQKIEADNSKCTWNFERYSKELDNKYTQQRKYDNKIFRHDLPDRIVLPSLPI